MILGPRPPPSTMPTPIEPVQPDAAMIEAAASAPEVELVGLAESVDAVWDCTYF